MIPWPHPSQPAKRHLDWFSHFGGAHPRNTHTHTQTTLRATSIAIGRILCRLLRACDATYTKQTDKLRSKQYLLPVVAEVIQVCMSVLLIVGPKCTLATSHVAPWWITVCMPTGQTDRRTDGLTPDRYISLFVRRGQRKTKKWDRVGLALCR